VGKSKGADSEKGKKHGRLVEKKWGMTGMGPRGRISKYETLTLGLTFKKRLEGRYQVEMRRKGKKGNDKRKVFITIPPKRSILRKGTSSYTELEKRLKTKGHEETKIDPTAVRKG